MPTVLCLFCEYTNSVWWAVDQHEKDEHPEEVSSKEILLMQ